MLATCVTMTWLADPEVYSPPKSRQWCKYDAFIPHMLADAALPIETTTSGVISDAERALYQVAAGGRMLAPLARLLLRTESIASSRVEGLQVGVRELARGEARLDSGGQVSGTTSEVLANIDAMELAMKEASGAQPFNLEHIVAIHRRLMAAGPNPKIAGRLRTKQNWIGGNDYNPCGADFVPPPPEHVPQLLDDLCALINDDVLPPVVQAAVVHAQFETIHPFEDGNGRTGRSLIHVVLRRRGVVGSFVPPISVLFAANKDRYIRGLVDFREGNLDAWFEHFGVAASRAAQLTGAYVEAVERLVNRWREALAMTAAPRADSAAWSIIEVLPAHPILTAPVAAVVTGRAKSSVHAAIGQLVAAEVLIPLSESRRNRSWEAAGLLDLIDDLENGRAPAA